MISQEHKDLLAAGARNRYLPLNCWCPNQCKFCYEKDFSKTFPQVSTKYAPLYTNEAFDFFYEKFSDFQKNNRKELDPRNKGTGIQLTRRGFEYFPMCDFFNLGLTPAQIEKIIPLQNVFYTTGLNLDLSLVRYLTRKYPRKFRLHLSVVTFDPLIRKDLMHPGIDTGNLKKICNIAFRPTYFLLYFNKEQIVSDIGILNKPALKNKGSLYIHKLYYGKFSPQIVKDYADKAEEHFKAIIYYLKGNDKKLGDISGRLRFSPASKIYSWVFQKEISRLLKTAKGAKDAAIFCSKGAYPLIRGSERGIRVIPVENSIGGCVDFALGIRVRSIIRKLRELSAGGNVLKHAFLPSSMFVAGNKFDLSADSIDLIRQEFPGIKVKVIDVPSKILHSTLSLEACFRYFLLKEFKG